jgi:hypothetical protein
MCVEKAQQIPGGWFDGVERWVLLFGWLGGLFEQDRSMR